MKKKVIAMKGLTTTEKFKRWESGEHTYSPTEYALLKNKRGEKISQNVLDSLKECSICPVGNASCIEYFEITIHGNCPNKAMKLERIRICPLGCNSKTCILNK